MIKYKNSGGVPCQEERMKNIKEFLTTSLQIPAIQFQC